MGDNIKGTDFVEEDGSGFVLNDFPSDRYTVNWEKINGMPPEERIRTLIDLLEQMNIVFYLDPKAVDEGKQRLIDAGVLVKDHEGEAGSVISE